VAVRCGPVIEVDHGGDPALVNASIPGKDATA
jgi:hypothetical protein